MTVIIIHGVVGSGKTTKAFEILPDDYISYENVISAGDLQTTRTVFVDDCDTLKKDEFKKIIKYIKGDLVLTCTDLSYIDKSIKSKAKKINTGKIDKRKNQIREKYPHSTLSENYNDNIFKILEHIYTNQDRAFVNQMLNDIKPNLYSLLLWMSFNGDDELLQYIDEHQLFKVKPQFIYSTIAFGVKLKNKRIQWPKKSSSEKIDEDVKKYFKLRLSDMSVLKDILQIPKVIKPKTTKVKIAGNPGKKLNTNKNKIGNKKTTKDIPKTIDSVETKQSNFDAW